jgi:hypothetical protein
MPEVQRTEVITSAQRRQWWSVEETLQPGVVGLVAAGAAFRGACCSTEAADGRGRPGSGSSRGRGDRRRQAALKGEILHEALSAARPRSTASPRFS